MMTWKVLLSYDDVVFANNTTGLVKERRGVFKNKYKKKKKNDSRFRDSNPGPFGPGASALTSELQWLTTNLIFFLGI